MNKVLISLLALSLLAAPAAAQRKLIEKYLSNKKDSSRRPSFMPVPVFGYSQEIGVEFGLGALYSFYADRTDTAQRSSNFSGNLSTSTKKIFNISLNADGWAKGNRYHYIADVKIRKMPFDFFGTGNSTAEADKDRLVQNMVKLAFDLEKRLLPHAYTGVSTAFEQYHFTDKAAGGMFSQPDLTGAPGGRALFIGLSQSYDTRNSNNYPGRGFFGRVTYQYAPDLFGAGHFSGSRITANLSNFWTLHPKFILGAQGIYQTVQSRNTPFWMLPQLGNDEMMRGYYTGRYRDENLLAFQAELRFRYNHRFGAAVFAGTGQVFGEKSNLAMRGFKPNYGAGFRYFFDPEKGLSVRLDYGVGEKRPNEKRQGGFYISLAEAF
ncbi:polymerase [Pedobacter yulinensis]|uniref:Polymerase n=1 Tax=Pedobacter yulinensis TaxID=2126353 RepID=A0A2T3HQN6_9SPHI|nr:BamA/TamA family outer membrane protein [Pedobacter yulinensis]PST84713.1 polymerase [Pedobacter yulinensis]